MNEAAERLRKALGLVEYIGGEEGVPLLDKALAAERRETVERIRERLEAIEVALPGVSFRGVYPILDEEAAR